MDAVKYAQQHNIQVNKEIVFVSYANLPITSYIAHPPLASIEQYPYRQGEKAMGLLVKILNQKSVDSIPPTYYTEEVPVTLVKL